MILSHLKTSDNTEKGKTTKWRHDFKFIEKIFSYFEYLENQLHRLDVIWQPIRRHITLYTLIKILLWVYSVSRMIRLSEFEYCVTVTFVMTNTCPFFTSWNMQVFLEKHCITSILVHYSTGLAPCESNLFLKLKSTLKGIFQTIDEIKNVMRQLTISERKLCRLFWKLKRMLE